MMMIAIGTPGFDQRERKNRNCVFFLGEVFLRKIDELIAIYDSNKLAAERLICSLFFFRLVLLNFVVWLYFKALTEELPPEWEVGCCQQG